MTTAPNPAGAETIPEPSQIQPVAPQTKAGIPVTQPEKP